jgi:hypothetical protein
MHILLFARRRYFRVLCEYKKIERSERDVDNVKKENEKDEESACKREQKSAC